MLTVASHPGPDPVLNCTPGIGLVSPVCWRWEGTGGSASVPADELVGHQVEAGEQFCYALFCPVLEEVPGAEFDRVFDSTAAALDLLFDDGSRLSSSAVDQYGFGLSVAEQQAAKVLQGQQWNLTVVDLDDFAGRRIAAVEIAVADRDRTVHGWLDAVQVRPAPPLPTRPVEWVRTTRGSHASGQFSRGNNAPVTCVPHGFVFGIPVTHADDLRWPYRWHGVGEDARPRLQGFSLSHIPSPWIADRGVFTVMPSLTTEGAPETDPQRRSLGFDRATEVDRPHRYAVDLDGGADGDLAVELTTTDHVVVLSCATAAEAVTFLFEVPGGAGELRLEGEAVEGFSDASTGRADVTEPRAFLHAEADGPVLDSGTTERDRVWIRVGTVDGVATVRLAQSFLGTAQAAHSLDLEARGPVAQIVAASADAWDAKLSRIRLEGASPDQLTTLYSNLYRLFAYPNSGHENAGTEAEPRWVYADPFRPAGAHSPDRTGCDVVEGRISVNNGFWDTYRTAWPMLQLLDPQQAAVLLDGFVEHFRTSGWTSRWSAPGPVDCMTGTSNDIVIADALRSLSGCGGAEVDRWAALDSVLRNASVPPTNEVVGRKGQSKALFRRYADIDTEEGMSWTIDAAINDFAALVICREVLAELPDDHPRAAELRANLRWFASRARDYDQVFDPRVGFFLGRTRDGEFRVAPDDFEPAEWGHDYTETNAWGTAFTVPHDGAGLAALHGGRDGLLAKLEQLLATPETGADEFKGSYGHAIHEMTEARNCRMGMLALSNQPAHHIPWMFLHAGAPHRTQALVRESVRRLWLGSEIGQGYCGDEDNGEMSAWWIFGVLGLYPLTPGSGELVIGSPLLPFAEVRLGEALVRIVAPDAGADRPYVRGLRVDGEEWTSTAIPIARLRQGAVLEFDLSNTPQAWGSDPAAAPYALGAEADLPPRLADLLPATQPWSDDDDAAPGEVLAAGASVTASLAVPRPVALTTITVRSAGSVAWRLESSWNGEDWQQVAAGDDEFRWDRQTRAFEVDATARHWRLVNAGSEPFELAQWELLSPFGLDDPEATLDLPERHSPRPPVPGPRMDVSI